MDLRTAAHLLGGVVSGGTVLFHPPGHSARGSYEASIRFGDFPDGMWITCFAADDPIDVRDYVKGVLGIGRDERKPIQQPRPAPAKVESDEADRTEKALALWHAGRDIPGSLAETYLKRRSVWEVLPDGALGDALRWHRDGYMVALVRDIVTDAPKAVHRTFLDREGNKLDRAAKGPIKGGAIKLTDNADVTLSLAIGEGIETALSIRRFDGLDRMSVWSVINANTIRGFPILSGIEALWIAVDNDDSGTGQAAAQNATERWTAAGREVVTLTPTKAGADLNDLGAETRAA